jgi:hypothetical protein
VQLSQETGAKARRPPQLDYVDLGYLSLEGHSRQESIQAFLERIKAANAEYQVIVVVWDNSNLAYLPCLTMSCFFQYFEEVP